MKAIDKNIVKPLRHGVALTHFTKQYLRLSLRTEEVIIVTAEASSLTGTECTLVVTKRLLRHNHNCDGIVSIKRRMVVVDEITRL